MPDFFTEGVKPGGLTSSFEIRVLLCYLLDTAGAKIGRAQLEDILLGEELANYFVLAESIAQLKEQGLVTEDEEGFCITDAGRQVAQTLAKDVPRTVREAAVRGVIRAQQYAARRQAHASEVVQTPNGRLVRCNIGDATGPLFQLELYMPDALSAEAVREKFVMNGDDVYKLVLAALTDDRNLAQQALEKLQ